MKTHTATVDLGNVTERKFVRVPGDFLYAVTAIVALRAEQWEPNHGASLKWWLADSVDDETWTYLEDTNGDFSGMIGDTSRIRLSGQARRFVVPMAPALAISVELEVNEFIAHTKEGQFENVAATVFWRTTQ